MPSGSQSKGNKKNLNKPWAKGESGNPFGKPKGLRSWHVVLRELFESGKITQDELAFAMADKARKGNIFAAQLVWDRMDGKAKETHEINNGAKFIPLDEIDNPQLKEELLRDELEKLKKKGGEK